MAFSCIAALAWPVWLARGRHGVNVSGAQAPT